MTELDVVSKAAMGARFGANIRRLRLAAGISGEELALALGITGGTARNAISEIERGRLPNLHRAHRLAVALGVTLDQLVAPVVATEDQRAVSSTPEEPPQPPTG